MDPLPLLLSSCVPNDAPELARIHYEIFSKPPIYSVIYAGVDPDKVIAKYQKGFQEGIAGHAEQSETREATYWKVTDRISNTIVAYSILVYLPKGYDPEEDPQAHADELLPGSNEAVAKEFQRVTGSNRSLHDGRRGPHFLISLLGTHPQHERRGAASMLVKAMFGHADEKGLPCYVDSSMTGHLLYERLGFKDVSTMQIDLDNFEGGEGFGLQRWMGMMREPNCS